ncbi:MAG: LacI family DNA-binding transcriptional regulator [Rhizomicrobium sp.]|nr:LacI family DNA-binding transcriptional regulator [Rhizomicrobium sp.]
MSTIKDVAKKAGVGIGTVSRVITGKGFVSEQTAKRVQKAVDALGYRPSPTARKLQAGKSQTIGVFLPVIRGSFYAPILHSLYTELQARGRHMVVAFGQTVTNERQEALEGAQFLIDHGCDGLILMATALKLRDVENLIVEQPRLALLNKHFDRYAEMCFVPDHEAAGAAAARALWQLGHRRFATIEGPEISADNVLRMRGFYKELTALSVDVERIPRFYGDFMPKGGWAGARALLAGKVRFTALFCANDEMALGALSYLSHEGVAVPDDISVMGYDGLDITTYTVPPLTTIGVPWTEIVLSTVNYLLNCCYGTKLPVERNPPATILWRGSVAAVGTAKKVKQQPAS